MSHLVRIVVSEALGEQVYGQVIAWDDASGWGIVRIGCAVSVVSYDYRCVGTSGRYVLCEEEALHLREHSQYPRMLLRSLREIISHVTPGHRAYNAEEVCAFFCDPQGAFFCLVTTPENTYRYPVRYWWEALSLFGDRLSNERAWVLE
jgi:hypothetical protein